MEDLPAGSVTGATTVPEAPDGPDRTAPHPASLRRILLRVVAGLVLLVLVMASLTLLVELRVRSVDNRTETVLVPAQVAADSLAKAYVDQETGERGYLLTGDSVFLQPFQRGREAATRQQARLARLLQGDAAGLQLLQQVSTAGARWLDRAALPDIASRQQQGSAVGTSTAVAGELTGKELFDGLRSRLDAMTRHLADRVAGQVVAARHLRNLATSGALVGVALSLGGVVLALSVLRRRLDRPLAGLLDQVGKVAGGDFSRPVRAEGPAEVVAVAQAVEAMRLNLLSEAAAASRARQELAVLEAAEQIARDLHDTVIQRLFAIGMRLSGLARAHPESAAEAGEVLDGIDTAIREMRTAIFGLTAHQAGGTLVNRVKALVGESRRSLGFLPMLTVDGPVDTVASEAVVAQLVPSLTEMLSNVARHARAKTAEVALVAGAGWLSLTVADNGMGPADEGQGPGRGLRNLSQRAESLGGSCSLLRRPGGGTLVEWRVPTGSPGPAVGAAGRDPGAHGAR